MLKTKRVPLIVAVSLLTSAGAVTSCVDSSYDLKEDIDLTISVGGENLTVPVGETEKITLDKIIEIEEGDDLQLVNGEYHLIKEDAAKESTTNVQSVTIKESSSSINALTYTDITASSSTPVSATATSTGTVDAATAENIDEAVKEIGRVEPKSDAIPNLVFTLTPSGSYTSLTITLMSLNLPTYLILNTTGMEGVSFDNENHTLTLTNITTTANPYTLSIPITSYDFLDENGKGVTISDDHKFISGNDTPITINSNISVTNYSGSGAFILTPNITVQEMQVGNIYGLLKPDIEETESTSTINGVPDFLKDDETTLDISNPIISFTANNPLNTEIALQVTMTSTKNNATIGNVAVDKSKVIVPANAKGHTITLARKESGVTSDQEIIVDELNQLVTKVPDNIKVVIKAEVYYDYYFDMAPETTYTVEEVPYKVDIPLAFGENLKILYEETIDDFDLDLDETVEIDTLVLSITADNTIPLELEIRNENVVPMDANGNTLENIQTTVSGTIAASTGGTDATMSTSNLSITMVGTEKNAFNQLDGISFKVTSVSGQATDVQLLSTQWLQLRDMKLKVPHGIKIDLN